VPPFKDR